ncbi:TonB family protein [Chitinophaga sp.]|uniref:energy transducer TonB n=1 Tax=Chitinophaga sp. TaxID=1869181 RepID=UPI0031D9585C
METTKLLKSDFLDILFDDRNKDYGAYELRRRYNGRVRSAVLGMSAIVLIVIGGYTASSRLMASNEVNVPLRPVITETKLTNIVEEKPVFTPPPTVREPAPAISRPTVKHATFVIKPDEDVRPEDEPGKNADLEKVAIGVKTDLSGDPNGADNGIPEGVTGGSNVVEAPKVEKKDEVQTFVEIMPEFPGGEAALARFLTNNLRYPGMAAENGVQGVVFVKFVVRATGEISDVELIGAKKGAGLDEEALRVVKRMPKWKPGKQNGQHVSVYFNLPINFKLQDQ